jgi:hypothetical protein
MLAPTPTSLVDRDGVLRYGLTAAQAGADPAADAPRRGRLRRWRYAAGGDHGVQVGAAVIDLGYATSAFAWVAAAGDVTTWERKGPPRSAEARGIGPGSARWERRGDRLVLGTDGRIDADLDTDAGRVRIEVVPRGGTTPITLVTPTPDGGWNTTEKAAGYQVRGMVSVGPRCWELDGGGWRDATTGRQDRRTSWRWAAGAGHSADGRRVGMNVSTGMNAGGDGEDVVWVDGTPTPVGLETLAPVGEDLRGPWHVAGEGWELAFTPHACRAADERLPLVRSRYVQPVGTFRGTLPGPDGRALGVELVGVTEEHEATW